jgi:hypothetical protein
VKLWHANAILIKGAPWPELDRRRHATKVNVLKLISPPALLGRFLAILTLLALGQCCCVAGGYLALIMFHISLNPLLHRGMILTLTKGSMRTAD